jgi:hypothetical protein
MSLSDAVDVIGDGPTIEEREELLVAGADALRAGRRRAGLSGLFARNRVLVTLAASFMTLGVGLVLVGWYGAAHSTLVEEQVPYLISGGLLGGTLALIGALCLLAHWMTVLIGDERARHAELMTALRDLTTNAREEEHTNGTARGEGSQRTVRRPSRRR